MKRQASLFAVAILTFVFSGCATLKDIIPMDVDETAQAFFDDL